MKNNKFRDSNGREKMIGRAAEEWQGQLWEKLVGKISAAKSREETKKIMESLVSDYEKKVILRRLAVIALVRSGKSYREIGEILWTSPQTISTIKKNSIGIPSNYRSYKNFYGGPIKYSDGIKIQKSFLDELLSEVDIWELLTNPPRPTGMGFKDKL